MNAGVRGGSTSQGYAFPKLISSPFAGDFECRKNDMLNTGYSGYWAFPIKPSTELGRILSYVTACVADLREWSTTDLIDGMSLRGRELRRIRTNVKYRNGKFEIGYSDGLTFNSNDDTKVNSNDDMK